MTKNRDKFLEDNIFDIMHVWICLFFFSPHIMKIGLTYCAVILTRAFTVRVYTPFDVKISCQHDSEGQWRKKMFQSFFHIGVTQNTMQH